MSKNGDGGVCPEGRGVEMLMYTLYIYKGRMQYEFRCDTYCLCVYMRMALGVAAEDTGLELRAVAPSSYHCGWRG